MTEIGAQRLTHISKDGLVCYKDHKSPNVISTYDIKATHSLDEACTIIDILSGKLADYEAIGTIEEFKALKEKNTPMELAEHNFQDEVHHYLCPSCRSIVSCTQNYCDECGQALDWQ